jgi:hypothetical protein
LVVELAEDGVGIFHGRCILAELDIIPILIKINYLN